MHDPDDEIAIVAADRGPLNESRVPKPIERYISYFLRSVIERFKSHGD